MNGVNSSLKEKIAMEKMWQKKSNIKFLIALLLSNLTVFLLVQTPNHKEINPKTLPPHHIGHQPIELEAKSSLTDKKTDTLISVVDDSGKIIFPKAYFLKENSHNTLAENSTFTIEIPEDELIKLSSIQNKKLLITPLIKETIFVKKKKGLNYEINI